MGGFSRLKPRGPTTCRRRCSGTWRASFHSPKRERSTPKRCAARSWTFTSASSEARVSSSRVRASTTTATPSRSPRCGPMADGTIFSAPRTASCGCSTGEPHDGTTRPTPPSSFVGSRFRCSPASARRPRPARRSRRSPAIRSWQPHPPSEARDVGRSPRCSSRRSSSRCGSR